MTAQVARFLLLCFALFGWNASTAQTLTSPELQRLLQSMPLMDTPFQEKRQSPWLDAPVESRGIVRSLPHGLEKQIDFPRRETWRLLPDHLEWKGPGEVGNKQILFSQNPALAAFSNALRRVVAGDLLALESDFRVTVQGNPKLWTVYLQPNTAELARYLDHLEMQGAGAQLLVLIVVERKGERTTTRFFP